MFLEQYKLEANPFAADAARPVFASHSMRYALLKLDELFGKQIQSLFLSGAAGVGKTTLTRQRLRQLKDLAISWIKPTCETREQLLAQLLEEIGPGPVEGSAAELRHILEVFLRHQAGNGRSAFVVADGLERFAAPVLRELEALAQMRLRNRPDRLPPRADTQRGARRQSAAAVRRRTVGTRRPSAPRGLHARRDPLLHLGVLARRRLRLGRGARARRGRPRHPGFHAGHRRRHQRALLRRARCDRGALDGQQSAAEGHARRAQGSRRQPEPALRRLGLGAARRGAVAARPCTSAIRAGCGSRPRG